MANAGEVPKLEALCVKLLGENIKDLHKMPVVYGMPFEIVRQVLYRCNADQLLVLEEINPVWVEDTGKHWEQLVRKDFKTEKRQECEAWREMYLVRVLRLDSSQLLVLTVLIFSPPLYK
jgi:hypothetical protein